VKVRVSPEIDEGKDVSGRLAGPLATDPLVVYLEL
jgi:hypothetical protein